MATYTMTAKPTEAYSIPQEPTATTRNAPTFDIVSLGDNSLADSDSLPDALAESQAESIPIPLVSSQFQPQFQVQQHQSPGPLAAPPPPVLGQPQSQTFNQEPQVEYEQERDPSEVKYSCCCKHVRKLGKELKEIRNLLAGEEFGFGSVAGEMSTGLLKKRKSLLGPPGVIQFAYGGVSILYSKAQLAKQVFNFGDVSVNDRYSCSSHPIK